MPGACHLGLLFHAVQVFILYAFFNLFSELSKRPGILLVYHGIEHPGNKAICEGGYGYLLIRVRYLHTFILKPLHISAEGLAGMLLYI